MVEMRRCQGRWLLQVGMNHRRCPKSMHGQFFWLSEAFSQTDISKDENYLTPESAHPH